MHEEEAVGEVDHPEREPRGNQRQPEALHLPEEAAVELEPQLEAAVGEQDEVDDQRAREVPGEHPDRALVPDGDEQDRRDDGDDHVGKRRGDVRDRALLDPEERGQLLVVHLRPEQDERGADEVRARVGREQHVRDLRGEDRADHEPERGHHHREPEGGAYDRRPAAVVFRVEVEAEERHRDAHPQDDHEHDRERDQRLDGADVGARQIARHDRQQEDADQPRDDGAHPVDGRVLGEPSELVRDHALSLLESHG